MASALDAILVSDEIHALPVPVREKLDSALNRKDADYNKLKIQLAKFQAESDQKFFDLDSDLKKTRELREKESEERAALQEEKSALEKQYAEIQQQMRDFQAKIDRLEDVNASLKREKETLSVEKDDLASLLSRKNDDVDRLTAELKALTDQLLHANREKSEAMIKGEELDSKLLALDYKERRLDQEREMLGTQNKVLRDELDAKTKEVIAMRREKTSKVLELQADVAEKIEELKIAQRSISDLKSTVDQQEKKIRELTSRLKDLTEAEQKMAENSRNELRSQMRLCELYKASSEDAQCKADEFAKATEELQRLLRDASARYGELETDSKAQIDQLNDELKKTNEANAELRKELERANVLLETSKSRLFTEEALEAMSPSAAAASRLMKSGMTLTQIFSQYVALSEQLLLKEEENKRLSSNIDEIIQEIEERAPAIARQKEDYEKSIEMVANLNRQLQLAIDEAEKEKEEALEARRQLGFTQRNCARLEKQAGDLARQVRFLLREVEELRGNRMEDAPGEDSVSSTDGSAAAVISRHLVTFRDVEELQLQNQRLLNSLREVTEKGDEEETRALGEKTRRIEEALEKALAEVEQMRDARRRQEELFHTLVQQRDTYQRMVQDAGLNESRSPTKFPTLTSTPAAQRLERTSDVDSNEYKIRLETQEANFKALVQEKKEVEKSLNVKIQQLQDSLADVKANNARLGTQLEYAAEKESLLTSNVEGFKRQIASLEEKNQMYSNTVAKHEQSIAVLRDEAMNVQQQLSRAEVTISMLEQEKQLLKSAEQRLLVERDSLLNERRSQNLLQANLESIKLNLERSESETRIRLQNNVTALEQQVELLRKKLENEELRYRETVQSFEEKLEQEKAQLAKAEEKASQLEMKLNQVKEMSSEQSPARLFSVDEESVKELKTQLNEAKAEARSAASQLELAKKQVEQYREIADRIEEQLKKNNEAAALLREETQRKLKELNDEKDVLTKTLEDANNKIKTLEEGAAAQGQLTVSQKEEIAVKIKSLEDEIEKLKEQLTSAEECASRARQDFYEQANLAKEAQERYERELVQHAADVESLNKAREASERNLRELSELKQSASKIEEELKTGKESWLTQKELLEKEVHEKSARCNELEKQVDLMQQQIVNLSTRMAAITRVHETPVKESSLNVSIGEEERSNEQLLELVRFLKREKEISISRAEVQEAECQRLKTQLEIAEKQLAEAKQCLQTERERSATSTLTFEKHTEMLRKLETLNALTDSNRLLREERVHHTNRIEELASKVRELEAALEPLKRSSEELNGRIDELSNENQALKKQVLTWKARATALQEKAGQVNVNDLKRLQNEKETLQKQLDSAKEQVTKLTNQLTEAVKAQDEGKKASEESEKLKTSLKETEAKLAEEKSKSVQLRKIALKYKTDTESLKLEVEKLQKEKTEEPKQEEQSQLTTKIEELEAKVNQSNSELEAAKTENATLKANEEKTKNVLKTLKTRLASFNNLVKEKETLTAELNELKAKIETLEQGNEEANVRSAALKSQLEGRLNRLERENGELTELKQSLESEVEALNQKLAVAQRQIEAHQKQSGVVKPVTPEVVTETPTANIKPMETPTAEIKPMAGQSRATPTASIRPMAATRTAAVQPMTVSTVQPPTEEAEPVAGPSGLTSGAGESRQQKRSREETEEEEDEDAKRVRVQQEEGEVLELLANPEENEDSRGADIEFEEGQELDEGEDVEDEAEEVEQEGEHEEEAEVVEEVMEGNSEEESRQTEERALEVEEQPVVEGVGEEEAAVEEAAEEQHEEPVQPPPAILPPPRESLPPFPRPTIAYDDGGDDGIVPSTPVLLPPRANDGFAEAVSSPQVNTRFVFGAEMPSSAAPSHLESQGMEDTRMDLSQLDENRAVPASSDEQVELADLEGDAAAEMDLLRDDEQADQDVPQSVQETQEVQESAPSEQIQVPVQQAPVTQPPVQQEAVQQAPVAQQVSGSPRGVARRGRPPGRAALNRSVPAMMTSPPSRPVPITWSSPTAQPGAVRENPRLFRSRGGAAVPPSAPVQAGLLPDPLGGGPGSSPVRGRGASRGRARRAARRP